MENLNLIKAYVFGLSVLRVNSVVLSVDVDGCCWLLDDVLGSGDWELPEPENNAHIKFHTNKNGASKRLRIPPLLPCVVDTTDLPIWKYT